MQHTPETPAGPRPDASWHVPASIPQGGKAYVPMRKDALVATLERLFNSGDPAVSDAAKAAATRWLPPGMAFQTAVEASSIGQQAPQGDAPAAGTA